MATLGTWINRARRLNYVDEIQYTDSQAVEDANIIIHQIEDYITSAIGEGYFWDILTAVSTVVGQSEYTLPVIESGDFEGVNKIENISIKYGNEFTKAREVNRETMRKDLSWYSENHSEADPIYFITDSSYFIFPAPKVAVAGGIKLYGIKSLRDITINTDDNNIFGGKIPKKYYYMISDGMGQFIKKSQGKEQDAIIMKQQFENVLLPSLVEKLGNRKVGISLRGEPNLYSYKT